MIFLRAKGKEKEGRSERSFYRSYKEFPCHHVMSRQVINGCSDGQLTPIWHQCTSCDLLSPQDSWKVRKPRWVFQSPAIQVTAVVKYSFAQSNVLFTYAVSKSTEGNATLAFKVTSLWMDVVPSPFLLITDRFGVNWMYYQKNQY